jgi:hypothetical protein
LTAEALHDLDLQPAAEDAVPLCSWLGVCDNDLNRVSQIVKIAAPIGFAKASVGSIDALNMEVAGVVRVDADNLASR